MELQLHDELVYLHDFADDECTYEGIYPKGARDKKALTAPLRVPHDFLIGGHRYLFKKSFNRYPHQFWIEIAAYRLGCLMGVPVPPSFVAYDPITEEFGALIEWFYDFPGSPKQAYFDGGVYMMAIIDNYDMKVGKQHNFDTISTMMKIFQRMKFMSDGWADSWAKIFIFDAIIGNTDRHHDNWGIVWTPSEIERKTLATLAPAFDNGTSLGHEIIDRNLSKYLDHDALMKYISRGTHHAKWDISSHNKLSHADFIKVYVNKYPTSLKVMLDCLHFDSTALIEAFYQMTKFDVSVPFSEERAAFMVNLVESRRLNLLYILEA